MSILAWTWIIVGLSFALYIYIAYWAKAKSTGDFYAAEQSVPRLHERHGHRRRLDVGGLLHLHGRPDLASWVVTAPST